MKKISISVRKHFTMEQLKDLLDSAFYGSQYWCNSDLFYESEAEAALTEKGIEIEEELETEARFVLGEWRDHAPKLHTLNLPKIKRGLTVMANKYPEHFADFINEKGDMNTGDVFLQCCLFGEVKYS